MANSHRVSVNYTPRMTDLEAYEKLGPTLRKAMQDSVNDWSAYSVLRFFNKHGLQRTVKWLRDGDEQFMRKGWIPARGKRKAMQSSFVSCRVKPLRVYEVRV